MSSHPVRRVVALGTGDIGDYVIRLRWDTHEGRVIWVDYEGIEITAHQGQPGVDVEYERRGGRGSNDITPNLDEAQPTFEGSLKWDGCMDFTVEPFHACGKRGVDKLCEAIQEARRHAALTMGEAFDSCGDYDE